MPPTPSTHDHEPDTPELSDDDVELLHQIVLRAQQRHDVQKRPRRALFEAYETIFSENCRDARRDRACLRIILQLGEPQIPGELLYDKFEFVLRQLGVTLAFGDDESVPAGDEKVPARSHRDEETFAGTLRLPASGPSSRRRASFTSMQDITNDQMQSWKTQHLSRAQESQLRDGREHLLSSQQRSPKYMVGSNTKSARRRRFSDQQATPDRSWMRNVHFERASSPTNRGFNEAKSPAIRPEDEYNVRSQAHHAEELFYQPSQSALDGDAEAFNDMRYQNLQRNLLGLLVTFGRERARYIQAIDSQAEARDFFTLKRQALDFWRSAYHRKRQQRREDRFFEHLYHRAGHAYDLYLLTKSFTHWIQITAGSVAKTHAARQRFLFTKYFTTWCDFTVSTELKAERQGQKPAFKMLQRRAFQYHRHQVDAVQVLQRNMKRKVFWRWFREWCDRAAPRFKDQHLQQQTFGHWLYLTRRNQSREANVITDCDRRSILIVLQTWATKTRIDIAGYHQADAFRKSRLSLPFLSRWNAEARLRPLERQILRLRDWKIARKNFSIWKLRARLSVHADTVCTKRILQNAHTAWNEKLRTRALAGRINNRIVAQTTYKWVIAQRCALLSRICDRRSRGRALKSFCSGIRFQREQLALREQQLKAARQQQLVKLAFASWNRKKIAIDSLSQIALNFYNPKLKKDTMEAIGLQLRQKEKLERWAQDARFYFQVTKCILRWRAAAADHKRSRERAAHVRMRRQCKLNLARNVLSTWRRKSRVAQDSLGRSGQLYTQKTKSLQGRLFRGWQAVAAQIRQSSGHASMKDGERLRGRCLESLIDVSRHISNLQYRAEQFHHLRMSELCSAQLRRVSLRAFEVRRRDIDADAMHDRSWNKHVRNMIRHWAARTHDSVYKDLVSNMATEKPDEVELTDAGYGTASNDDHAQSSRGNELGATRRAEEWTAFDHDLLEGKEWAHPLDDEPLASSILIAPGYLNTPPKRATRAKVLANLSTTPATPLRTPFAARVRGGIRCSPTSQMRGDVATNAALRRRLGGFQSTLGSEINDSGKDDEIKDASPLP